MKSRQAVPSKCSTGPLGSFESRTATASGRIATSTQFPFAALRVLLRQSTPPA
jgi:hypothetical protein